MPTVDKFGRNTDIDSGTTADLWDNGAVGGTLIWVAPTLARTHQIVSDNAADVSAIGTLTLTENAAATNTVTIGTKVYTTTVSITDVKATETLTLTENAANTNTVTLGTRVYTFVTTMANVANTVLIGAAATNSIDNLIAAIMGAAGEGTLYGRGTVTHELSDAVAGGGDTMDSTALTAGTGGNSIASTDTLAGASAWGGVNLSGGETNNVDGNVKIGAAATNTIDNLIAAINLAAGSGTTYAALTTANTTDVVALAGAGDTLTLFVETEQATATTDTLAGASAWGATTVPSGASARRIKISGLTSWTTPEVEEIISLHGTTNVPTVNDYVIIHRMEVWNKGATSENAGTITATADTDSTITAQINPLNGQTEMLIYGIPEGSILQIASIFTAMNKASGGLATGYIDLELLWNREPQTELTNFVIKENFGLVLQGTSSISHNYHFLKEFHGPGILKMQAVSGTDTLDVSAAISANLINLQ